MLYQAEFFIMNGYSIRTGLPSAPAGYNPFDLENDGKTEIVVAYFDSLALFAVLDGSTFVKKYDIKGKYNYSGRTITLNSLFYGFYDIDGDNEREAVAGASDTSWTDGLAFLNVKSQTVEYFIGGIPSNNAPSVADINNDGFLELIAINCIIGRSATQSALPPPLSKKPSLSINSYPNPTTSLARINYNVPIPSIVNITVYNAAGRLVRQLIQGRKPAGNFTETWNGKSDDGEDLAPGEYYYEVRVGKMAAMKRMVLLK